MIVEKQQLKVYQLCANSNANSTNKSNKSPTSSAKILIFPWLKKSTHSSAIYSYFTLLSSAYCSFIFGCLANIPMSLDAGLIQCAVLWKM